MAIIRLNFFRAQLTSQLLVAGTTANITAGMGARFAGLGSNKVRCVLQHIENYAPTKFEIVDVTARSTDALTISRAVEDSANFPAAQFEVGDWISCDITAEQMKSVYARVYHSADQAIGTGSATAVAFNSERWDTDTIHDDSTNNSRLTCKTAGWYRITANIGWESSASGNRRLVRILLNGATILAQSIVTPVGGSQLTYQVVTTDYLLAVNDYVEVHVLQDTGGNLNVLAVANTSPEFSMTKLPG